MAEATTSWSGAAEGGGARRRAATRERGPEPEPEGDIQEGDIEEGDIDEELAFREVHRARPFALVSPGFEQRLRPGPDGPRAGWQVAANAPVAPWLAVELTLDPLGGGPVGGEPVGGEPVGDGPVGDGPVLAGLVGPDGHLAVTYDPAAGRVEVQVAAAGQPIRVLRRRRTAPPRRLAFVLCGRRVSALVDTGRGWRVLLSVPPPVLAGVFEGALDVRDPDRLATYRLGWRGPATGCAGTFGLVGLRDPHLVQHRDGRPYERDGQLLLTATCAGVGDFHAAHWGVFTLDPHTYALAQIGHVFSRRGGLVLGDHAGQVVVDEESGTCEVLVSSWGDFDPLRGVHVRRAGADLDVLTGVSVLSTQPLALPTTHSTWDPGAVVIDGRWQVSYVQSPSQAPFDFRPALASGTGLGSLVAAGCDPTRHQCEGPVLARLDGTWRLLASDSRAREYPVYDLPGDSFAPRPASADSSEASPEGALRAVGRLAAPYGSNLPHPQVAPAPDGGTLMVTFDGTPWPTRAPRTPRHPGRLPYGTHGDLVVLHAEPAAVLVQPWPARTPLP